MRGPTCADSEFNVDAIETISAATLAHLATGAYMTAGEPVVLLGDSGTGKSHLLIGLGIAACEQGRSVRYTTTARLVNELVEAAHERVLSRVVSRYGRLDLLCLDELGYVQVDPRGAELLLQMRLAATSESAAYGETDGTRRGEAGQRSAGLPRRRSSGAYGASDSGDGSG